MSFEQLKLKHQLCFPLYAASRLVIREYQPFLDKLGLTYPQYLALLVLWENEELSVQEIASILILNTNTLTPLLKRMEKMDLITRKRSKEDERVVKIALTQKGRELESEAKDIPYSISSKLLEGGIKIEDYTQIKEQLQNIIRRLNRQEKKLRKMNDPI